MPGIVTALFAWRTTGGDHYTKFTVVEQVEAKADADNPLIYPGSTERTAFAEKDETKGYVLLDLRGARGDRGMIVGERFVALPTRPMVDLEFQLDGAAGAQLAALMDRAFAGLDPQSILRLTLTGRPERDDLTLFSARALRHRAPRMNIEMRWKHPRDAAADPSFS
jgi:DNA repair exonuclease SbcCD nuclease subunit